MSIVSTETIGFKQKDGTVFKREIRVLKDGLFRIKLPPEVSGDLVIEPDVCAVTMSDAINQFDDRLEEYDKINTCTAKVILYEMKHTASVMRDGKCVLSSEEISFCEGTALNICVAVYEETVLTRADGTMYHQYKKIKSLISSGLAPRSFDGLCGRGEVGTNRIPWTLEREKFFADLGEAMENLILKIDRVMSDKQKVIALADSGTGLLAI